MSVIETRDLVLDTEMAEQRATRIGLDLDATAERFESAMEKMRAAIRDRDDLALGYRSPGEYLSERFGGKLARLGVDLRREVVRELTEAGLSTRAIAPIVGVTNKTVALDRRQVLPGVTPDGIAGVPSGTPDSKPATEAYEPFDADAVVTKAIADATTPPFDPATGEVLDVPASIRPLLDVPTLVEDFDSGMVAVQNAEESRALRAVVEQRREAEAAPAKVLGLDGKTYSRPTVGEQKQRRRALIDSVAPKAERIWSDSTTLRSALDDDRLPANRDSITEVTFARFRAAAVNIADFMGALNPSATVETEEARDRLVADLNHISETYQRLARSLQEEPK